MEDEEMRLSYALSKQLQSVYALQSTYGDFELDGVERRAVENALRPILERKLKQLRKEKSS